MRKLFATIFWMFTAALVLINIVFLVYLVCRTFNITALDEYLNYAIGLVPVNPATYNLGLLWAIYLIICIPVTALLQHYGKNLGNSDVALPFLKTIFDLLTGILKIIIMIALIGVAIYLVFHLLIPALAA